MKMFLLSDNTDTFTGMRLVGVEGKVVHNSKEAESELNAVINGGEYGIILYTSKLREFAGELIAEKTKRAPQIIFYEIPDRHGYGDKKSSIADYIKSAIGIGV